MVQKDAKCDHPPGAALMRRWAAELATAGWSTAKHPDRALDYVRQAMGQVNLRGVRNRQAVQLFADAERDTLPNPELQAKTHPFAIRNKIRLNSYRRNTPPPNAC